VSKVVRRASMSVTSIQYSDADSAGANVGAA